VGPAAVAAGSLASFIAYRAYREALGYEPTGIPPGMVGGLLIDAAAGEYIDATSDAIRPEYERHIDRSTDAVSATEDVYWDDSAQRYRDRKSGRFVKPPPVMPSADGAGAKKPPRHSGKLASMGRAGTGRGVREVPGGVDDAKKLFDKLRGDNPVTEVKPGVYTAKGSNGGTVTFRASSKSGPPTVDVHGVEEGIRKIKFVEE